MRTVVDCSALPGIEGGTISYSGNTTYDSMATYSCDTGYDLQGGATRTCQADGHWDESEPSCISKKTWPTFVYHVLITFCYSV